MVSISCQGRTLDIVCEGKTLNGEWREIETNQRSWCGTLNSEIQLEAHHFYTVPVACYNGTISTKLRYKMRVWANSYIYSNEITGQINPRQLE